MICQIVHWIATRTWYPFPNHFDGKIALPNANLITSEATRASYVLHHPFSVLVYRFSFVIGRSADNENYLRDGTLRRAASNMRDFVY